MRSSLLRRVGLAVAGTAAALASTVALVAPAAQADFPPPCHIASSISQQGNTMVGTRVSVCDDGNFDLPVKLQKMNPSTGAFVTVASGEGFARYQCTGTAFSTYRIPQPFFTKSARCS